MLLRWEYDTYVITKSIPTMVWSSSAMSLLGFGWSVVSLVWDAGDRNDASLDIISISTHK